MKQRKSLKAVSNVIELKPEGKYLLVISGSDYIATDLASWGRFLDTLRDQGIDVNGVVLNPGEKIEAFEIVDQAKEVPQG